METNFDAFVIVVKLFAGINIDRPIVKVVGAADCHNDDLLENKADRYKISTLDNKKFVEVGASYDGLELQSYTVFNRGLITGTRDNFCPIDPPILALADFVVSNFRAKRQRKGFSVIEL